MVFQKKLKQKKTDPGNRSSQKHLRTVPSEGEFGIYVQASLEALLFSFLFFHNMFLDVAYSRVCVALGLNRAWSSREENLLPATNHAPRYASGSFTPSAAVCR